MVARTLLILGLVLALRLPFLRQAIQGDDVLYLTEAEHAQIEPLHPMHAREMFRGQLVDMRGHSHPPLNGWILAALLAGFGEVREVPFHLAYTIFSIIAAMAMWALARRFSSQPLMATLLFCAVPAFVVNGNSLESDLPFLAFWMSAIAFFVNAADTQSGWALIGSIVAAALAGLSAYQAIFLTPILAVYLWQRQRAWLPGWIATLAAPAALITWQLWERASSGSLPASVLAGYLSSSRYNFESLSAKISTAASLIVHLGWMASPIVALLAAIRNGRRWQWLLAALSAAVAAVYDSNPLFWVCIGCGVWLLSYCVGRGFLGWWVVIFFAGAMAVFFVGPARYLLPIAAPVSILLADAVEPGAAVVGVVLQLALALTLATVNYQHWNGYRQFAKALEKDASTRRVWINSEWGFRYYLEAIGGLPLALGQPIQPGELVVTSDLAGPLHVGMPMATISRVEIRPAIPLRLNSLAGHSAYAASSRGLLPFEISRGPIDSIRAEIAVEPVLSYLDAQSGSQIVGGWFPDGWMMGEAIVLLKVPSVTSPIRVSLFLPPVSPARHIRMAVNDQVVAEQDLPAPGLYEISGPAPAGSSSVVVKVSVDKTFSAPPDVRSLGVIVKGIGFR